MPSFGCCAAATRRRRSREESAESKAAGPKFQVGKTVCIDVPRSVGPPLVKFRGQKGTVKSCQLTREGRVYSISVGDYVGGSDMKVVDVKEEWLSKPGATAQSSNVQPLPLINVLKATHRIPTFQRRYCWCEAQWKKLWTCIETVRDNSELNNHSLQRLMLLQQKDGVRLVLDGQQRLTTVTLMMSAICDRLSTLGEYDTAKQYQVYCQEGRLVPTMYDRPDFKRCLSESFPDGDSSIVKAKRCFSELARSLDSDGCEEMAEALLNRVSVLSFVVDNASMMQSIFEKMALRTEAAETAAMDLYSCFDCYSEGDGGKEVKATHFGPEGERLCAKCAAKKPGSTTMTPGIPMSPIDVIRNFVFDHYPDDEAMKAAYEAYWGPMEMKAGEDTRSVEASLAAFLEHQGFPVEQRWSICDAFKSWWGFPDNGVSAADFTTEKLQLMLQKVKPAQSAS